MFEALLAVLDGLSREAPVLLVIEDLHWADASTRAFLRFLAATLGDEPLLLVATYRPDELHRRHPLRPLLAELERVRALRIDLAALTRDELGEQLADILGAPPEAALVDRLYARSEGNPLFTEELLAAGLDGRGAVPPSLAAALALRIERLGDDAQEIVRVLSAGGRARRRGARRGLRAGARARCATGCARRSRATSSCSTATATRCATRCCARRCTTTCCPGERAELHRALARALEAQRPGRRPSAQRAAAIAHHYLAAGDQPAALAAAVRAGVAAMEVQAYREGAALFERALELWDRVPDAAELTGDRRGRAARARRRLPLLRRRPRALGHARASGRSRSSTRRPTPRRAAWLYGLLQRALWALLRAGRGGRGARARARAARRRRAEPRARRPARAAGARR